jgi:chemotaxis protein CheC
MDELSILTEVGNIAAGHGSIALSAILGRTINLSVPSADVICRSKRSESMHIDKVGVVIFSKILVGLKGEVVFIMDEQNAFKLMNLSACVKAEDSRLAIPTEVGLSMLKEVGHIIIGAYLNALSMVLKRVIIPPLPTLINGTIEDILNLVLASYADDEFSYLIETVFSESKGDIQGSFFMILTPEAAKDIKETCNKILDDMEK